MSTRKDEVELRSHLGDLIIFGFILIVLLMAIRVGCVDLQLPFKTEQREPIEQSLTAEKVLQALESRSRLCTAEMAMEVMLDRQKDIKRFLLPDGFTDVTARIPGTVRAAVNLEGLRNGDLEVSSIGGLTCVLIRLPPPEISDVHVQFPGISWDHSSDWLQVFRADTDAILIRAELLAEARRILPERAVQAGLLIAAARHTSEVLTDIARSLGADRVEVIFKQNIDRGGPTC